MAAALLIGVQASPVSALPLLAADADKPRAIDTASPMAAVDKVFEVSSHGVIIPKVAQKEDDCDPDTEWIRLETTPGRD